MTHPLFSLLSEETPDAAKTDPMGAWLFAPQRPGLPSPKEPNTPLEDDFLKALNQHYDINHDAALVRIVPKLLDLVGSGKYTKLLEVPHGTKLYRILFDLSPATAAKILEVPLATLKTDPGKAWYLAGEGTLRPKTSKIQSWTPVANAAMFTSLATDSGVGEPNLCTVLFVADAGANEGSFLLNPFELLKRVKTFAPVAYKEVEVVSYGPVTYEEAAYLVRGEKDYNLGNAVVIKRLFNALNLKSTKGPFTKPSSVATKAGLPGFNSFGGLKHG